MVEATGGNKESRGVQGACACRLSLGPKRTSQAIEEDLAWQDIIDFGMTPRGCGLRSRSKGISFLAFVFRLAFGGVLEKRMGITDV